MWTDQADRTAWPPAAEVRLKGAAHSRLWFGQRPFDFQSGDAGGDRSPVLVALTIVTAEFGVRGEQPAPCFALPAPQRDLHR
jgi:hypothetical protein